MNNESTYWERVARHHIASRRLYHVDTIVHVEDADDIPFWLSVFQHVKPNKRVKFIASDMNQSGNRITGKKHCLKYVPFLCGSFLICIDSDFDHLLQVESICNNSFVLQTYTYSWENHYCFAKGLQKRWKCADVNTNFSFEDFLDQLNPILYKPVHAYLVNKINHRKSFTLEELCSSILKVHFSKETLSDNGTKYLSNIRNSVSELMVKYGEDFSDNVQKPNEFKDLGFVEATTYLYMQGHCIYDLISRIGKFLLDGSHVDFEYQVLRNGIEFDGYNEMIKLQKDLSLL